MIHKKKSVVGLANVLGPIFLATLLASVPVPFALGREGQTPSREISLCGAVYCDEVIKNGLTDLLLTELSTNRDVRILDRHDLRQIIGELSLKGLSEDSTREVLLGELEDDRR